MVKRKPTSIRLSDRALRQLQEILGRTQALRTQAIEDAINYYHSHLTGAELETDDGPIRLVYRNGGWYDVEVNGQIATPRRLRKPEALELVEEYKNAF